VTVDEVIPCCHNADKHDLSAADDSSVKLSGETTSCGRGGEESGVRELTSDDDSDEGRDSFDVEFSGGAGWRDEWPLTWSLSLSEKSTCVDSSITPTQLVVAAWDSLSICGHSLIARQASRG
jgi:hypothetical protein